MGQGGELVWRCRDRTLRIGARPLVMGILNVTPDSFSDGGRYPSVDDAVRQGLAMVEAGADMIDVGGESTRPGSMPVSVAEECARVAPVIRALGKAIGGRSDGPVISVDTRKAAVAEQAMAAGASIINDVSALGDPEMSGVARRYGAGVVLMHMRGEPATMQQAPCYEDVVAEVSDWLGQRLAMAEAAGVAHETVALDPGIGFGKTGGHNVKLLAGLPRLAAYGRPLVVGVSRKRFIGLLTGREVGDRLAGSLAGAVLAATRGAHVWRVHDVKESVDAARMVAALREEMVAWIG